MSEDHGLDLDALFKANGGHSIFAPSGAAMWLTCSGSLIPNLTAPDDAGEDAAYGTVGHSVAEEWLLEIDNNRVGGNGGPISEEDIDAAEPKYLLGRVVPVAERSETFNIEIDEEMMSYVRQYIEWCAAESGDYFIEQRVYFSEYTPLPEQGGTADFSACQPRRLVVTDLKMGRGVEVYAADDLDDPRALKQLTDGSWTFQGNPQAMIYALGFVLKWDHKYDFDEIVIRIAQPRRDHFQTWTTTKAELLKFAAWMRERAAKAWVINAPRTASAKGCKWCKVKRTCVVFATYMQQEMKNSTDDVFEPVDQVDVGPDGVIENVSYREVTSAGMVELKRELDEGKPWEIPPVGEMTTEQMARILPYRQLMEKLFSEIEHELEHRALDGEVIPGYKLVEGRLGNREFSNAEKAKSELAFIGLEEEDLYTKKLVSPNQAEEKLMARFGCKRSQAKALIDDLVSRKPGRHSLVTDRDKRPALEDVGSVFDDVSADDHGL